MTAFIGRREFISLLCGARRLAARGARAAACNAGDRLSWVRSTPSFDSRRVGAFVQRLRERGWIEGRTSRSSIAGRRAAPSGCPEIAAELVRLRVDVIVATGGGVPASESRRRARYQSCSPWQEIRLATAWLRAWPDRAAMLPACRSSRPILPASGLSC